MIASPSYDLDKLRQCSAEIGANRLLVQAAGGNTSIKENGVLWIKASGTCLADALTNDIFVAVDLAAMAQDIQQQPAYADQPQRYLIGKSIMRPSIETSLHAVFSQRVVLHVHCVNTIAFAVLVDAESKLSERLRGFEWAFVPYAKPGAGLAQSVTRVLQPKTCVVVLGNHGLLVTGNTVEEAHARLLRVQAALKPDVPVMVLEADTQQLVNIAGEHYEVMPAEDPIHQAGLSKARISHATGGSLYPDHVTFCGVGAAVLKACQVAGAERELAELSVLVIVPEAGVLIRTGYSAANLALARCLSDVVSRVPEQAELNYLTAAQNHELMYWEAETYRQKLNA